MNPIKLSTPENTQVGGHYSSVAVVNNFIFTAGHVPRDANRNILGQTMAEQTTATLNNLLNTLKSVGAGLNDIVQVRVSLSDLSLSKEFNTAYAAFFGTHKPARTVIGSALNEVMVEIDVIAYKSA